jgi:NADH-quinone oxidoreductase subunit L
VGDQFLIDGLIVNGSAKVVGAFSAVIRRLQTGFIYSYATAMIIGLLALMTIWFAGLIAR